MLNLLADLQHEIWSHWMRYLFKVSVHNEDGTVTIPADQVKHWKRQMITRYADLSFDEQKSDLEQAKKVVAVVSSNSILEQANTPKKLE